MARIGYGSGGTVVVGRAVVGGAVVGATVVGPGATVTAPAGTVVPGETVAGGAGRRRRGRRSRRRRGPVEHVGDGLAGLVERLGDLVLLELGGRQVGDREHRHRDAAGTGRGDDPAGHRVAPRLQPPPPAPDVAAPDRHLDEAVRRVGDHRGEREREHELGDRQRSAGHAADDLVDRPVEEIDPVRPDADPQQHRVAENGTGPRAAVGDAGDQRQRGEPGQEEPAAEQPWIDALGRDDVEVPAQRRQSRPARRGRRRRRDGPSGAADRA